MTDIVAPLYPALRAVISDVWGIGENGIYHAVQLARVPFELKVQRGELPIALLDVNLKTQTEGPYSFGMANRNKAGQVMIYYVDQESQPEDDLQPKLQALSSALWPSVNNPDFALEYGVVLYEPDVSFSLDLPLNRYFLGNQKAFLAGAVTFTALVQGLAGS